jgi:hypothetical protein
MWDEVANVATKSRVEQAMKTKDYTTSFTLGQSPDEVFDPITNVRGWLLEEIDGSTDKRGAEHKYRYKDIHRDAYDRAIGLAEDPAVKEFLAQRRG